MPDFFTRLAERTLGVANTIQPVVPSLFAPGAPLIDGHAEGRQELTIEEQAPQSESAAPPQAIDAFVERRETPAQTQHAESIVMRQPTAPPAPTVERVRPPQPQINPATRAEPNNVAPPAEAHQMIEPSAAPSTRSESTTPQRSEPTSPTARREQPAQLLSTPDTLPSVQASPQHPASEPRPPHTTPSARSLVAEQPLDLDSPGRSTSSVPIADERQAQSVERRAASTQTERPALVPREPLLPLLPPTSRAPEPSGPQPAPQIHVSIGRIEVRAVTPQPAEQPKPRPAPTPRMSLDDYLRSQNGDRR
ncbi:MAG TPA: hypothetical protein VGD69_23660 [Herpetosiphonaceae bacterium]